ncbi:MAG: 30S ribosome-binding factor RbfA [Balneolaceae bacterium]
MSIRTERLAAVIQKDLGEILQKKYQLIGSFITVTEVRMTPDLSIARVYVSVYAPGRDKEAVFRHIDDHNSEIRQDLASRIRNQVRRIPELHFFTDETSEVVNRMEQLFKKVKGEESDPDSEK